MSDTERMEPSMTWEDACNQMAAYMGVPSGRDLWNMSPSGELWPVIALYEDCVSRGMPDRRIRAATSHE